MNVFLTGGSGFIGQPLTKALLKRGWRVTVLVRKPESLRAQALVKMGAQAAAGDITERESMRSPMTGADIVVHNAGVYEVGLNRAGKERMQKTNVEGTENVLSLADELGIQRTVYVSTVQAYGETGHHSRDETFIREYPCRTTYEQTKTEAHKIACQYMQRGLPLIIVCPNGVLGPNDQSFVGYLIRLYINRVMPPMRWGSNIDFCVVFLDDLVEGITLAVEKGRNGETYFFCGEHHTMRQACEFWEKKPGAYGSRIWVSAGMASAMVAMMEPFERMLGLPAFLSREAVRTGTTNWYYCSDKAQHELGWTYCSAEEMWFSTIDGEIQLLSRRKGQNLIQRLKPLDLVE
jgi:nucleoside-diphosphate-sugar epimerase